MLNHFKQHKKNNTMKKQLAKSKMEELIRELSFEEELLKLSEEPFTKSVRAQNILLLKCQISTLEFIINE